jgi:hypothetical protein
LERLRSLVQLATPDAMRRRVGAVPSVVLGGIGTVGVALLWMKLFPKLRDFERLE